MRKSLLALAVCAISVQMAGCKMTHNGSLMKLTSRTTPRGEWVEIRYLEPRPELRAIGVNPGTVLVRGWGRQGGAFSGQAFVFSASCAPVPYRVSGKLDPDQVLRLKGWAPIVDPHSCFIVSYARTGNSLLEFVLVDEPWVLPAEPAEPPS